MAFEQSWSAAGERIVITIHGEDGHPAGDLEEIRRALTRRPRQIPSRFFYDERGSQLFERICDLPEYYPYRAERQILERQARRSVRRTRARELVELGPGASTKTRLLLDAMEGAGSLVRYVPLEVNEGQVRAVASRLVEEYPGLQVHGIVGDFAGGLDHLPSARRRLIAFLGGTIGNLLPPEAHAFLDRLAGRMHPEDALLVGIDLRKEVAVLEAAYNASQGVTAEFNRNILHAVNRIARADFDPQAFRHRAFYNRAAHRIEMRLASVTVQRVRLARIPLEIELDRGEEILTEVSLKYDRSSAQELFGRSGFRLVEWLTDERGHFALSLWRPSRKEHLEP